LRSQLFDLAAFEPTDEEICMATGQDLVMDDDDDDVDETLGGFIVPDGDEDDDEFGKALVKRKPKQPNRAVVQDSDDDDQVAQQSEAEEEPAPQSAKAKGKKKVKTLEQIQWVREQEPSTKMLWAMAELERMFKENPEGASSLPLLPRRAHAANTCFGSCSCAEKVIIISSFVAGLDILDTYLESKGVRTLRYQGDMSISDRDETLRTFRKSKKRKVRRRRRCVLAVLLSADPPQLVLLLPRLQVLLRESLLPRLKSSVS